MHNRCSGVIIFHQTISKVYPCLQSIFCKAITVIFFKSGITKEETPQPWTNNSTQLKSLVFLTLLSKTLKICYYAYLQIEIRTSLIISKLSWKIPSYVNNSLKPPTLLKIRWPRACINNLCRKMALLYMDIAVSCCV